MNVRPIEDLHVGEAVVLDDEGTEVLSMLSYGRVQLTVARTARDDVNRCLRILVHIVRVSGAVEGLVLVDGPQSF